MKPTMPRTLPPLITEQTVLPVIAAPMFLVSGPELVLATCKAGIIGSFPAPNGRTVEMLDEWMGRITHELAAARRAEPEHRIAPWAANIVVHRSYKRLQADLELVTKYKPSIVITALGSPAAVVEAVHAYGGLVLADVNSITYAHKAVRVGADGLVLVSSGAGGHTGSLTAFAFIHAVREFWDGIVVLAGGIANGRAIRAAQVLGADLVYMGTRFIAARESLVSDEYRQMLVDATIEDLIVTNAFTGVHANMLKPSIRRAGLDPDHLKPKDQIEFDNPQGAMKAWKDIWSAGQSLVGIKKIQSVAEIVSELRCEYTQAVEEEIRGDAWTELAHVHTHAKISAHPHESHK
jgi:nitronate monooxygenase